MSAKEIKDILNDPETFNAICQAAFDAVDTDKSGFIDSNEFAAVVNSMCADSKIAAPTKEELDLEMSNLDTNGDKKLSMEEFKVIIRSILTALSEA